MTAAAQANFDRWLSTSLGVAGPDGTRLAATRKGAGGSLISGGRSLWSRARGRRWRRDYEQLLSDPAIARLDGVTQVLPPSGSVSTRLSHSRTVAELASEIAAQLGLDSYLAAAIGLAHDCGHPPYGHAGEYAVREHCSQFSHAQWGASKVLTGRGYSLEVRDGVRSHSWSENDCRTPEAEIVRWADRIAYLTEDLADAIQRGLIRSYQVPSLVTAEIGEARRDQQHALTAAVVDASRRTGRICMNEPEAEALSAFRMFNADAIYQHPVVTAANAVGQRSVHDAIKVLRTQGASWSETITRLVAATDTETAQFSTAASAIARTA